jgi:hypothetical protein
LLHCRSVAAEATPYEAMRSRFAQLRLDSTRLSSLFEGAPVYERLCSLSTTEFRAEAATTLRRAHKRGGCPEYLRIFQRSVLGGERGSQRTRTRARTRIKFLKRRMRHYRINSIRIKGDTAVVTDNTSVIHGEGGRA